MIFGIGNDLVQVARVEGLLARFGEALPRRMLAPVEWDDFRAAVHPALFLASRFAAKEAFAKATGNGVRAPVSLGAVGVVRDRLGRPGLWLREDLARWLEDRAVAASHLSLSHEAGLALATVVLECR